MFGLSNSAVRRLYKTWEVRATAHVNWCPLQVFTRFGLFQRIPSKTKRIYCSYERLMVNASYSEYASLQLSSAVTLLCCSS